MILREIVKLPLDTAECESGPIVEFRGGCLTLSYDAEGEHGAVVWATLRYRMVLAVRFTPDPACEAWMVGADSRVCEVDDSDWSRQIRTIARERGTVLSASARHFVIYFDHVGCWEVLADDFELEGQTN